MARILFIVILYLIIPLQTICSEELDSIMNVQMRKSLAIARKSDKSNYNRGIILIKGDSIYCDIYRNNKKRSGFDKTMYSFVIARLSNDSLVAYTANQVDGFIVNGNFFKQHCTEISGKLRYFFIRLLVSGNVCLYDRDGYILNRSLRYYILFNQADHYIVIDAFMQNLLKESDNGGRIMDINGGVLNLKTQQIDAKFKAYFSYLLNDCESVRNKILEEFYTMNDLTTIITEYNKCK